MCNIPPQRRGGNCRFAIQMGTAKKGVHALHVLSKSSSSMEEHVYGREYCRVWSWDLTEMSFGETLTKESKKLQYLYFFFPTTSPRSVQRGGGGQLNKLRRMGILWCIAAIAIETRQLKTNRLVVIIQKLWGFQRAETKTTGILSAYQWEAN